MKFLKKLFLLAIVAVIGFVLFVTCPTTDEFAAYYMEQHETGLGSFIDGGMELVIQHCTDRKDYVFFAVFELNGKDRYVGVLGNFFGRSSAEELKSTMEDLVEQAKDILQ